METPLRPAFYSALSRLLAGTFSRVAPAALTASAPVGIVGQVSIRYREVGTVTVGHHRTAIGGDAVEISFCASLPMAFGPKHIFDTGTRLTLPQLGPYSHGPAAGALPGRYAPPGRKAV